MVGALAQQATTENVPALLKLLDSDSVMVRHHVVSALGRLQSPAAIERLAQLLLKGGYPLATVAGPEDESSLSSWPREDTKNTR